MFKNPFMYVFGNLFLSIVSLTRKDGSVELTRKDGSVEFQVFSLTKKIGRLSSHLELHKKDYSSQRGLRKIAGKRQRLLAYLSKKNKVRYIKLIGQLNIRDKKKPLI